MNLTKVIFAIPVGGIILGTLIAVFFGANEAMFKDYISNELKVSDQITSIVDPVKQEKKFSKEKDKNWRYFQRFHFHSTAINSMSLALLLLLFLGIQASKSEKLALGLGTAITGFLYPFYWLFAGYVGPSIGRSAAKEMFAPLGYMGGIYLVACLGILFVLVKRPLNKSITA